jgi:hypothetical protein
MVTERTEPLEDLVDGDQVPALLRGMVTVGVFADGVVGFAGVVMGMVPVNGEGAR